MTVFWTVLAGTVVFVLSQYILKILIEPAIEMRKALADLSQVLLFHQAKITNNRDDDGTVTGDLKRSASRLWAAAYVIPMYRGMRWKFQLPPRENVLAGCKEVNLIANNLVGSAVEERPQRAQENAIALKKIGELLGIVTRYRD